MGTLAKPRTRNEGKDIFQHIAGIAKSINGDPVFSNQNTGSAGAVSKPAVSEANVVTSIAKSTGAHRTGDISLTPGAGIGINETGSGEAWDYEITADGRTVYNFCFAQDKAAGGGAADQLIPMWNWQQTSNATGSTVAKPSVAASATFSGTWSLRGYILFPFLFTRSSDVIINSTEYNIFNGFPRDGDSAQGTIVMRYDSSGTGSVGSGLDNISFHLTDGTNISAAPGSQFSAIDTTFRKFETGVIDISSWGDALYWVLKINGENTSIGPNANKLNWFNLHSVFVEEWP